MCMASTRAHSGWFTRSCVALPSTNPTNTVQNNTKTVQQPSNNRTQTVHKSPQNRYNNPQSPAQKRRRARARRIPARIRPLTRSQNEKSPLDPKGGAGATPRHTALRRGGGGRRPTRRAAPTPRTPRAAPVPPLATLRYGAARAAGGLPEGPPQPRRTPSGGAGATPRHPAPRRGEGDRRPTRRAAPTVKKVTPRPLR